jgi:hypothetical protein
VREEIDALAASRPVLARLYRESARLAMELLGSGGSI